MGICVDETADREGYVRKGHNCLAATRFASVESTNKNDILREKEAQVCHAFFMMSLSRRDFDALPVLVLLLLQEF